MKTSTFFFAGGGCMLVKDKDRCFVTLFTILAHRRVECGRGCENGCDVPDLLIDWQTL